MVINFHEFACGFTRREFEVNFLHVRPILRSCVMVVYVDESELCGWVDGFKPGNNLFDFATDRLGYRAGISRVVDYKNIDC